MRLRLIRHATLIVELAGRCILVDPMLDPAGARPPVENTPNDRRNPLVELPEPVELRVDQQRVPVVLEPQRGGADQGQLHALKACTGSPQDPPPLPIRR